MKSLCILLVLLDAGRLVAQSVCTGLWDSQGVSSERDTLRAVVWTGSQFVAVGDLGSIRTSPNGVAWTTRGNPARQRRNIRAVASGGAGLVAFAYLWNNDEDGSVLRSADGITWTESPLDVVRGAGVTSEYVRAATWTGSLYVGIGGGIITSPDGVTWTSREAGVRHQLNAIVWTGSQLVIVGTQGTILTSRDGVTWTSRTAPTAKSLWGLAWTGTELFAVGDQGTILTSADGVSWRMRPSPFGTTDFWSAVAAGNSVMVGGTNVILTGANGGTQWSVVLPQSYVLGMAASPGAVVAVGSEGVIMRSACTPAGTCAITCSASVPATATAGQEVSFRATAQATNCASPVTYTWSFGDGTKSSQQNATKVFAAGRYNWILTATAGSTSCVRSATIEVTAATTRIRGTVSAGGGHIDGTRLRNGSNVAVRSATGVVVATSPIAADGSYDVTLPPGAYAIEATVNYVDDRRELLPGGVFQDVLLDRRATTSVPSRSYAAGTSVVDVPFPNPVLFLHGILSSGAKWDDWLGALPPDRIVFSPTYSLSLTNLDGIVSQVADQLRLDTGIFGSKTTLDVVAHSRGGLLARAMISDFSDWKFGRGVLLGTPNDGSACGLVSGLGPDLSRCDVQDFNAAYPSFPIDVAVVAGSSHRNGCWLDDGVGDGWVPIDSVFKITSRPSTLNLRVNVLHLMWSFKDASVSFCEDEAVIRRGRVRDGGQAIHRKVESRRTIGVDGLGQEGEGSFGKEEDARPDLVES